MQSLPCQSEKTAYPLRVADMHEDVDEDDKPFVRPASNVEYGFGYTVNRSFTMCHPLTLLGLRALFKRTFQ